MWSPARAQQRATGKYDGPMRPTRLPQRAATRRSSLFERVPNSTVARYGQDRSMLQQSGLLVRQRHEPCVLGRLQLRGVERAPVRNAIHKGLIAERVPDPLRFRVRVAL